MHCGRKLLLSTDKKAPSPATGSLDSKRRADRHLSQVDKREKINTDLESGHDFLVNFSFSEKIYVV